MFNIKKISDTSLSNKNIDQHKNILIMGEGETDYKLNQIVYFGSSDTIDNLYGESELSNAYLTAKSLGIKDIFVINIKSKLDYISILDIIAHHDFSYIIPLGFKFSDEFYDPINKRNRTYTELYVTTLGIVNNSTVIVTDEHASLYEDIDSYINEMETKIYNFKQKNQLALQYGNNLIFISNNLVNYNKANLILGCVLCTSTLGIYPIFNFGDTVFDIDYTDIWQQEFVYFKKNTNCYTSIENLNNFRYILDQDKIVTIDMLIKYIERQLDFSYFIGKNFTEYIRIEIYKLLSEFFKSNKDKFVSYKIKSVDFVVDNIGVGTIINNFSIFPINSVEEFNVVVEV